MVDREPTRLQKITLLRRMLDDELKWAVLNSRVEYAREIVTERAVARAKQLTERERNEDGSVKEWLAPDNHNRPAPDRHLSAVPTDQHPATRPAPANVAPLTGAPARTLGLRCTECESTFTDTASALAHEATACSVEYDEDSLELGATYEIITVQP